VPCWQMEMTPEKAWSSMEAFSVSVSWACSIVITDYYGSATHIQV
jgi:hypothetical protein